MAKRGLARLDELTEIARTNGWDVASQDVPSDDLPDDVVEAKMWLAGKAMADGRDLVWSIAYGRPNGRQWQALLNNGRWRATVSILEPTYEMGAPDLERCYANLSDMEYWLPRADEQLALWRAEGLLHDRQQLTDRIRKAVRHGADQG